MDKFIEIIPIGQAELPRVEALARRIWPECFGDLLGLDKVAAMVDEIYAQPVLERDLRERGQHFWLARVDGEDAGFVAAYADGSTLWIRKLYVLANYRGLGLGKTLIAAAQEYFPQSFEQALYVNDGNRPAIDFYRSQGFVIEKKVPVKMGPYAFEDYIMRRQNKRLDL